MARGIRDGDFSFPARQQEIAKSLGQFFFFDQFSIVKNADRIKPPRCQDAVGFEKLLWEFSRGRRYKFIEDSFRLENQLRSFVAFDDISAGLPDAPLVKRPFQDAGGRSAPIVHSDAVLLFERIVDHLHGLRRHGGVDHHSGFFLRSIDVDRLGKKRHEPGHRKQEQC
jgi:hypothetical protein